ncbi:L-threo-3-hydroxyaspartate ammonia-lyase [Capillimicrobium parvum]|uniref:threonine ammonia-lyase n=1 Tax=Capillimicrobium parvum TaxID=2884022 RepID=A0A9E7BZZ5_9ACTN|nr:L-threo-3-hydroxyaspartate ammonia-lyase [Capillimicrobium parvum]
MRSRTLDERVGARVVLKAENLQRVGAFKFRGAYNAVAAMDPKQRARGVVTASSGNHAQALALAARLHDVPALILMPGDAPGSKVQATIGYGAEIVPFDRYAEDREELLAALAAERGMTPVHPYDDDRVMAGQGTAALELIEDAGPLDALLVCIGGGGLIAGCATAAKGLDDGTRVVGVEPEAGDDVRRSLAAGDRVRIAVPDTIADGQQIPVPGERTWPVIRERVDAVAVASDAEIVAAMRFLFERCKLVVEPSGACALAALLAGRVELDGAQRIGVTLSGGNVDAARFARLLS